MSTTPMMEQYLRIKKDYQDAFLFFRLGDFYELFFDDAKKAAKELEITLTGRGKGDEKIPMCGVPHHSAKQYIRQLIDQGYKVAICEQTEDPQMAKGVVKREVVQVITPGTVMDTGAFHDKENNFLVALYATGQKEETTLAAIDTTTGEFRLTKLNSMDDLASELAVYQAKEVVTMDSFPEDILNETVKPMGITVSHVDEVHHHTPDHAVEGLDDIDMRNAAEVLFEYVQRTTRRVLDHVQTAEVYIRQAYMHLDAYSKRNLELTGTLREQRKAGSLLGVIDETNTAMGGRLLKQWIGKPLLDLDRIASRQRMVRSLMDYFFERQALKTALQGVYDLERLSGRVAFGNVNGRDFIQLKHSLEQVPHILALIEDIAGDDSTPLIEGADACDELKALLETSIREDCPVSITEGGLLKDGYDEQLDLYREAMTNGKAWIAELEKSERDFTGIKSLKVGFNKVFGYYIEVTKANIQSLPEGRYERKQTLSNAERYITEELKEKEQLILEAEEKSEKLEHELFLAIRDHVKAYIRPLQKLARTVSAIDVLVSFAEVSERLGYVQPELEMHGDVHVKNGRHPVVETMIDHGEYIANDLVMNQEKEILLITGPNMAGKSTYMRQLAHLSILAQIGCFVPAEEAKLPIFDQIFTRIGAADDLAQGQSTFMVEMMETRRALKHASRESLILLDEIGRGTSTYDGMSLAQAVIEYVHDTVQAKTLFSTHYHELTHLEESLERCHNVHVAAKEEDGEVVFLHKVVDGPADRSYGIYVAQLAELPREVIERAKVLLEEFESEADTTSASKRHERIQDEQIPLFDADMSQPVISDEEIHVLNAIRELNLLHLTPIQAIQLLDELKGKLKA
ncbi:DNA mismatch repair protein MutS [Salisediminibacterium beveridgei]|uniref:DNA mismatch repair protein MutS n=1 Tax=Salisediminibacterium beveridgei TaxID=632773 RepID=A0A1D7QVS0_9BACI|nr:DNA mismatch repair protein MutS [Salisediminibacterium beveridgei]AOM83110.1 DNA mismatch repair protein MutS [Salisediminibacterium beveridgei]